MLGHDVSGTILPLCSCCTSGNRCNQTIADDVASGLELGGQTLGTCRVV